MLFILNLGPERINYPMSSPTSSPISLEESTAILHLCSSSPLKGSDIIYILAKIVESDLSAEEIVEIIDRHTTPFVNISSDDESGSEDERESKHMEKVGKMDPNDPLLLYEQRRWESCFRHCCYVGDDPEDRCRKDTGDVCGARCCDGRWFCYYHCDEIIHCARCGRKLEYGVQ